MAKRADVQAFFDKVVNIFMERHKKYGSVGMTIEKAASIASTKLDRIRNGGDIADSAIDLAGYAVIVGLIDLGLWDKIEIEAEDAYHEPEPPKGEKVLVLREHDALTFPLPRQAKQGDAGLDIYVLEDTLVPAHSQLPVDVRSGVRMSLPQGYWGMIINRSSANKRGLIVASNVIDQGYQGELYATVRNTTDQDITLLRGERVAQMVLIPLVPAYCEEVTREDEFPKTERGQSGWGSTGK